MRLRPGKPTWFGARGDTLAFGLPGNPVSAMVTFQLFVRPGAGRAPGRRPRRAARDAPARRSRSRATREREQAVRVRLRQSDDGLAAAPTKDAQGSHVLTSMLGADGLALIAPGEGEAPAGERVEVELL